MSKVHVDAIGTMYNVIAFGSVIRMEQSEREAPIVLRRVLSKACNVRLCTVLAINVYLEHVLRRAIKPRFASVLST